MTRSEIEALVARMSPDDDILLVDGYDEAFLGLIQTFERGGLRIRALYSLQKCVTLLTERDGTLPEEALEHLDFNTLGAYVGAATPSFLLDLE